jgi:hypothetical protein
MRKTRDKLKRARSSCWIEVVDMVPHISVWRFSEPTQLVRQLFVSPSAASELYFHDALLPLPSRI